MANLFWKHLGMGVLGSGAGAMVGGLGGGFKGFLHPGNQDTRNTDLDTEPGAPFRRLSGASLGIGHSMVKGAIYGGLAGLVGGPKMLEGMKAGWAAKPGTKAAEGIKEYAGKVAKEYEDNGISGVTSMVESTAAGHTEKAANFLQGLNANTTAIGAPTVAGSISGFGKAMHGVGYAAGFGAHLGLVGGKNALGGLWHGAKHMNKGNAIGEISEQSRHAIENRPIRKAIGHIAAVPVVAGASVYGGISLAGSMSSSADSPGNLMKDPFQKHRQEGVQRNSQMQMQAAQNYIAKDPYVAGLRDTDEQYMASASNRGSTQPQSRSMSRKAGLVPGAYGDGGDLVFAMNSLRTR